LTAEKGKLVDELDSKATALQGLTTERDKFAAESRDFERRMSAELAQRGIRKEGVATPAGAC
jgi:hypothetical protein